jgi:hypothetical protein
MSTNLFDDDLTARQRGRNSAFLGRNVTSSRYKQQSQRAELHHLTAWKTDGVG